MKIRFLLTRLEEIKKSLILRESSLELKEEKIRLYQSLDKEEQRLNRLRKVASLESGPKLKKEREEVRKKKLELEKEIEEFLQMVPNIVENSIEGVVKVFGKEYPAQSNVEEVFKKENKHMFERGIQVCGRKFVCYSGKLAYLHRLIEVLMEQEARKNFEEVILPSLVNVETCKTSGHYPKFEDDMFKVEDRWFLTPTSEVGLLGFLRNTRLVKPLRLFCRGEAFRKEVGKSSVDSFLTKRLHQFTKVELFSVCEPSKSKEEHEFLTRSAEVVLEKLNLTYRRLLLAPNDIGPASNKTFDLETWLPSKKCYIEVSSSSNCLDFQTQKSEIKINGEYAHTLNASGLAVGRTMMCLVERFSSLDDCITFVKNLLGLDSNQQPND